VTRNLLGLDVSPMLTGLLADLYDLPTALALMPLPCVAAIAFWYGSGN
jgi:MFS transporter, Spinster family, sphingosine-1-phosphate transporter